MATRDHFSALAEGTLPAPKAELLRTHIEDCEICGPGFARFARGLDALAVERQAPVGEPTALGDQMLHVLGLPPRERVGAVRRAWRAMPRWGRVAAAVLMIGTVGATALTAGPGVARSLAAGVLGVEPGPQGTWVPADPAARAIVARELGPEAVDRLAQEPRVREQALRALGFVQVAGTWVSPAEQAAAKQRAAGNVRIGDRWVSVAAIERAAFEQQGLMQQDGEWVDVDTIADQACRDAGLVWFDGDWRQRADVEVALLRAHGFSRDGERWASPRERELRSRVELERQRANDLAIENDVMRRFAAQLPMPADEPGNPSPTRSGALVVEAPPGANRVLASMLDGAELLPPVRMADAIVIPIARYGAEKLSDVDQASLLVPATSAMAGGKVKIDNRTKVRLKNEGPHPVLIVAGEIITGGKQDRLIKRDVVVESGQRVELDVLCAEKDRSTARGNVLEFASLDAHGSTTLRRMIVSGASQEAVWDGIAAHHREANLHSPTKALQVTYTHPTARSRRSSGVQALQAGIQGRQDIVGVAIVRGGQVETIDIYPDPSYFRTQIGAIVAGIMLHDRKPMERDDASLRVASQRVFGALEAAVSLQPRPSRFLELDAKSVGLTGYVTAWKERGVHLCLVTPLRSEPPANEPAPSTGGSRPSPPNPGGANPQRPTGNTGGNGTPAAGPSGGDPAPGGVGRPDRGGSGTPKPSEPAPERDPKSQRQRRTLPRGR